MVVHFDSRIDQKMERFQDRHDTNSDLRLKKTQLGLMILTIYYQFPFSSRLFPSQDTILRSRIYKNWKLRNSNVGILTPKHTFQRCRWTPCHCLQIAFQLFGESLSTTVNL